MHILASHYITTTAMREKKVDKPFTLIQCECMLEYEHLFRLHLGADGVRAQVRPEQHMLLSVFKLNSYVCQFKHLRARGMLADIAG